MNAPVLSPQPEVWLSGPGKALLAALALAASVFTPVAFVLPGFITIGAAPLALDSVS